jgi:hypothetical protein
MVISPLLKWYVEHGLKVTQIHQVMEYTPATYYQKFGEQVSEARRAGDLLGIQKVDRLRRWPVSGPLLMVIKPSHGRFLFSIKRLNSGSLLILARHWHSHISTTSYPCYLIYSILSCVRWYNLPKLFPLTGLTPRHRWGPEHRISSLSRERLYLYTTQGIRRSQTMQVYHRLRRQCTLCMVNHAGHAEQTFRSPKRRNRLSAVNTQKV